MSTTFKTKAGDTFESIARQVYGTEVEAPRIRNANPGVFEPLQAGAELLTPPNPAAPTTAPQEVVSANPDEVAILIDNTRFRFWTSATITRAIDGISSLSLSAPHQADDPRFREALRPFTFKPVRVTVGGRNLFLGTMLNPQPTVTAEARAVQATAYSLPGVLADCTAPESAYPIAFRNGQTIKDVAEQLAGYFGISTRFDAPLGAALKFGDDLHLDIGKKVWPFLVSFAQTRNLLIKDDAEGGLVFHTPPSSGKIVAKLEQGASPLLDVTPVFDPQSYYSHVTGKPASSIFSLGTPFTVRNRRLKGVMRPFTFEIPDTFTGGAEAATKSKTGRMFANVASYPAEVATWHDPQGDLWEPGTFVSLLAPDAMVYKPYVFLIRKVVLTRTGSKSAATLELVIPEAFRGELPRVLPWDE